MYSDYHRMTEMTEEIRRIFEVIEGIADITVARGMTEKKGA